MFAQFQGGPADGLAQPLDTEEAQMTVLPVFQRKGRNTWTDPLDGLVELKVTDYEPRPDLPHQDPRFTIYTPVEAPCSRY